MALYSSESSLDCHRVRFVLAEKGINVDIVYVSRDESAAADLAELNPYNETPTLVDVEIVNLESRASPNIWENDGEQPEVFNIFGNSDLELNQFESTLFTKVVAQEFDQALEIDFADLSGGDDELRGPHGVATDSRGDIYVADFVGNAVHKVDGRTGEVFTLARNGNTDGRHDELCNALAYRSRVRFTRADRLRKTPRDALR